MGLVLTVAVWWFALSIPASLAFCWLLKTKRISFEPIVDRSEFDRGWGPRK